MEIYNFPTNGTIVGTRAGMTDSEHFRYYFCYKLDKKVWKQYSEGSLMEHIGKKSDKICKIESIEKVGEYTIVTAGVHVDVPAQQAIDHFELLFARLIKYGCFLTNANKPDMKELDEVFADKSMEIKV